MTARSYNPWRLSCSWRTLTLRSSKHILGDQIALTIAVVSWGKNQRINLVVIGPHKISFSPRSILLQTPNSRSYVPRHLPLRVPLGSTKRCRIPLRSFQRLYRKLPKAATEQHLFCAGLKKLLPLCSMVVEVTPQMDTR